MSLPTKMERIPKTFNCTIDITNHTKGLAKKVELISLEVRETPSQVRMSIRVLETLPSLLEVLLAWYI